MANATINFGFRSNAQNQKSSQREIQAFTDGFARMIIEDVAYSLTGNIERKVMPVLRSRIKAAVEAEIAHMAMMIENKVSMTGSVTGPRGSMSIRGQPSATAQARGWGSSLSQWNRNKTKIRWDPRNPRYLNWKQSKGKNHNWWEYQNELSRYLGNPYVYSEAFGPVRVIIERPRNRARLGRNALGAGARLTSSGVTGPMIYEYEVARVRVIYFGKITPGDLPSLQSENPADAKPTNGKGLSRFIKDDEQRAKLQTGAWKTGNQRFVLEPFVSFFMSRAIPNAVWRRIEQQPLLESVAGRSGNVGGGSSFTRSA